MSSKDGIDFKIKVHKSCMQLIDSRIQSTQEELEHLNRTAEEETKSSMGDKYETGRAMVQQEIDKQHSTLVNLIQMQNQLNQFDPSKSDDSVQQGSLIHTNHGWIYVMVGLGNIEVEGKEVIVISPAAPVVNFLQKALSQGESTLNGRKYEVKQIL